MKVVAFIFLCFFLLHAAYRSSAQPFNYMPEYRNILSNVEADTAYIFGLTKKASDYIKTGNTDSAALLLKAALKTSERIYFNDGIGQSMLGLGVCDVNLGNYDRALKEFNLALPFCLKAAFHRTLPAAVYNTMGVVYNMQSKYTPAVYYYFTALKYLNQNHLENNDLLTNVYNNIGYVWMRQGQFDQAEYYLKKAAQIAESNKLYGDLAKTYIILGGMYIDNNDLVKGRVYSNKGLELNRYYKDVQSEYCSFLNLAISYEKEKKPDTALIYFQKALKCATSNPYYSAIDPYIGISNVYFDLNDLEAAEKYLLLAITNARKFKLNESLRDANRGISLVYAKKGDYKKAYEYQNAYALLADSLTDAKQIVANHQLEVKYRTAEKDKDLVTKQLQINKQQVKISHSRFWILLASLGSLLLGAVSLLLFVLYKSNRNKQQLQDKQIHILQQEQQIVKLNAFMEGEEKERTRLARELHDGIGGMLASVRLNLGSVKDQYPEVSHIKKLDDIMGMLTDVSTEVRKTAHNLMPVVLLEHSLEEALLIYCANVNDGGKVNIDLQYHIKPDQLNKATELMLYRIAQELIQNIIKHANATYAVVQMLQKQERLCIMVEDNGTGFDVAEHSNGYGLQNLQFRIHALEGYISIMSAKGRSTTIHIEFDMEKLKSTSTV